MVAVHDRAVVAADGDLDALALCGQRRPVDRLGDDVVHRDRLGLVQRVRHLQPGQVDDLLDERGEAHRLALHPGGEVPDGVGVVGGVGDRLGQQATARRPAS